MFFAKTFSYSLLFLQKKVVSVQTSRKRVTRITMGAMPLTT